MATWHDIHNILTYEDLLKLHDYIAIKNEIKAIANEEMKRQMDKMK